jgi:secreted trypsin-like serine protease
MSWVSQSCENFSVCFFHINQISDSGSPLKSQSDNYMIGLVLSGKVRRRPCAAKGSPGVYGLVSVVRDWIRQEAGF